GDLACAGARGRAGAGSGCPPRGDAVNPGQRESITSGVIEFGEVAVILHPRSPHHCERSEAIHLATQNKDGLLRRYAPRNDGKICKMLTKAPHLFDDATRVTAG